MTHRSVLFIDASRVRDRIKLSVREGSSLEEGTLHRYDDKPVDWGHVDRISREVFRLMGAHHRDGRLGGRSLDELRRFGGMLLDELVPPEARELLSAAGSEDLIVLLDEDLVQIPWELLHEDGRFFCLRWNLGRQVRTSQKVRLGRVRTPSLPLKMLLVADPRGDLHDAYQEGLQVRDLLDADPDRIRVDLLSHRVRSRTVKSRLKGCDMFHYAGHAEYVAGESGQSGLLLFDGKITAREIVESGGAWSVPGLVFVNACRSGQTVEWKPERVVNEAEVFGLANAFLLSGARHYIGTFWDVPDELSRKLASCFYGELAAGRPIGQSLRTAREEIIRTEGAESILWATYLLYGHPSVVYVQDRVRSQRPADGEFLERAAVHDALDPGQPASRGVGGRDSCRSGPSRSVEANGKTGRSRGRGIFLRFMPVWLLCLLLAGAGWVVFRQHQDARQIAQLLRMTESDLYEKGNVREVLDAYRAALQSGKAGKDQLARLHGRLGRIYAGLGEVDRAVEQYEAALAITPEDPETKGNLCFALNRLGRYQEARGCMDRFLMQVPDDAIAAALLRTLEERFAWESEREGRQRIDVLATRLVQRAESTDKEPSAAGAHDAWTSRPMTIALCEPEDRGGLSVRDGHTGALLDATLFHLRGSPRLRVVDRVVMEKVMEELDLGTDKLADPGYSLSLGRILSARLIGYGNVYRDGKSFQSNLRFVNTETTGLDAAVSRTFPEGTSVDIAGRRLAEEILQEIRKSHPIRGRIVDVEASGAGVVNVGARAGLEQGAVLDLLPPEATDRGLAFARLEVVSVEDERARVVWTSGIGPLAEGCRVLEFSGIDP